MSAVANLMDVPVFDGHASPFAHYEETVTLWNRIATTDPQKRAANLLFHETDAARKVCMAAGKDGVGNIDRAARILRILGERFAPEAIDSIFQDMAKFMYFERADQNSDMYLMEFDVLPQKAGARMLMGSGFPAEFAPCTAHAKCRLVQR